MLNQFNSDLIRRSAHFRLIIINCLVVVGLFLCAPCFSANCNAEAENSEALVWNPKLSALLDQSRETWATSNPGLPDGHNFSAIAKLKSINGEDSLIRIADREYAEIKDLVYAVKWKKQDQNHQNTLIVVRNCEEVIVDNVHIVQLDKDSRAAHSILFENCGRVVVKNSSFKGTCTYHLRFEGCREVLIDSVEIAGFEYGQKQVRCGGGIWINNGDDTPAKYKTYRGLSSYNPRDLTYFAILNCWLHDNLAEEKYMNIDGVLVHSGSQGLIVNCRFENWQKGDSALDVSHRRMDEGYDHKLIRIERNIFNNCRFVKSVGRSNSGCRIIWCNNVFNDTMLADYHQGYEVVHSFEDFIFNKPSDRFMALWGLRDGALKIERCLFVFPHNKVYLSQGAAGTSDDYTWVSSDFNIFYIGTPMKWVAGQGKAISKFSNWKNMGQDKNSMILPFDEKLKSDATYSRRILDANPNLHSDAAEFFVPKTDYLGIPRDDEFCVGAFMPKISNIKLEIKSSQCKQIR